MQVLDPEFLSSVALGRQAPAVTSFHATEGRRPFNGRISRGYLFFRASRGAITFKPKKRLLVAEAPSFARGGPQFLL